RSTCTLPTKDASTIDANNTAASSALIVTKRRRVRWDIGPKSKVQRPKSKDTSYDLGPWTLDLGLTHSEERHFRQLDRGAIHTAGQPTEPPLDATGDNQRDSECAQCGHDAPYAGDEDEGQQPCGRERRRLHRVLAAKRRAQALGADVREIHDEQNHGPP